MERTKFSGGTSGNTDKEEETEEYYDVTQEPIVLSKGLLDLLLDQPKSHLLITLYIFYYYTAKWQRTNQIHATNTYVAKALDWGLQRVVETRQRLRELGLIKNVYRRDNNGQNFAGHYVYVKFLWSRGATHDAEIAPMRKPLANALSANSRNALSANSIIDGDQPAFKTFCSYFPKTWQQSDDFLGSLNAWYRHRHEQHSKLTTVAMQRQASKLRKNCSTIEEAIRWIEYAIEKNWRGLYEPPKFDKPRSTNSEPVQSHITPAKFLEHHFNSESKYWVEQCYKPAIELDHRLTEEDKLAIARGIVEITQWYTSNQKKPEFKETPKFHHYEYAIYCRWQNVPRPRPLLQRYVQWLQDQQWIKDFSPRFFSPTHNIFKRFLKDYERKEGYDFLTGRDL